MVEKIEFITIDNYSQRMRGCKTKNLKKLVERA